MKGSGKTTIIFNIASILAHKKYKVAIVELQYDSQYAKHLNLKNIDFKTRNIMKHYSLHNVNDNLTVFFLNSTLDQDDS
jgi:cellulose biosynthesis protein BcsQ